MNGIREKFDTGLEKIMESELKELVVNYPELNVLIEKIKNAVTQLIEVYTKGGKILVCGNGGSAADCEHIVGELLKEFKVKRPISKEIRQKLSDFGVSDEFLDNVQGALPAISLVSHIGFITAFNNDVNSAYVFSQQVYALGSKGDVLLGLSTSGNSVNVINAAIMAKAKGMKVISMTGETGGKLKEYSDVLLNVPSQDTARIQEYHLPIYHTICECLEKNFFG